MIQVPKCQNKMASFKAIVTFLALYGKLSSNDLLRNVEAAPSQISIAMLNLHEQILDKEYLNNFVCIVLTVPNHEMSLRERMT